MLTKDKKVTEVTRITMVTEQPLDPEVTWVTKGTRLTEVK